jgi:hypothetical protein
LLAYTFLRFQEHYESPKFRGKVFSLEEFMDWYAADRGSFSYLEDWTGFNIPSRVLKPFYEGKFDPLSRKEQALLDRFESVEGRFYIIGTSEEHPDAIDHELAHGLFYTNSEYRRAATSMLERWPIGRLERFLSKLGYASNTIRDEAHAHLACDFEYLKRKKAVTDRLRPLHKGLKALLKHYISKRD